MQLFPLCIPRWTRLWPRKCLMVVAPSLAVPTPYVGLTNLCRASFGVRLVTAKRSCSSASRHPPFLPSSRPSRASRCTVRGHEMPHLVAKLFRRAPMFLLCPPVPLHCPLSASPLPSVGSPLLFLLSSVGPLLPSFRTRQAWQNMCFSDVCRAFPASAQQSPRSTRCTVRTFSQASPPTRLATGSKRHCCVCLLSVRLCAKMFFLCTLSLSAPSPTARSPSPPFLFSRATFHVGCAASKPGEREYDPFRPLAPRTSN
ncbi:hypothetical protein TRVL_08143 [Trypanosoma vivax]|nr:hypothetical protein TRVL_08143 [Trypanosoma vivax]